MRKCVDRNHIGDASLPKTEFYQNKKSGAYQSYCKECSKRRSTASARTRRKHKSPKAVAIATATTKARAKAKAAGREVPPVYMTSKELLDNFGTLKNGTRKVSSETVQQLLAKTLGVS